MIRIVKASAGSGKTFRLTGQYLGLLLRSDDPLAYRHILAVTFTNKATGEMKRRILSELDRLARDPEHSPYTRDFVPSVFADTETLSRRARERLGLILHDYSAFSVSTIDRFFQQALRAFSREIGYFASYQVELDRKSLIEETVARVLESLGGEEDPEAGKALLGWLTESVRDELARGGRFRIDAQLTEVAQSLTSDAYRELIRSAGIDEEKTYGKEQLSKLIAACRKIIRDFNQRIASLSGGILQAMEQRGIPQDHLGTSTKALIKLSGTKPYALVERPSDAFFAACGDAGKWFKKVYEKDATALGDAMRIPLGELCDLFLKGDSYRTYRTAFQLRGSLYGLGLAGELRRALTALQKEKNVLSLDESNVLLRDIIDGADAPFVYEKIGVRYAHFLLDEFQDTSLIQWNNFLPLLLEANASGGDNLVVGDVKQSIYRFRDSDWRLLDHGVQEQFREAHVETKKENRRTLPEIVEQNGRFFHFAAAQLDLLREGRPDGPVSQIYADAEQTPTKKNEGRGSFEAAFCPDAQAELDEIVDTIRRHVANGKGTYGDIAILVRGHGEGEQIASRLIAEGIPLISDDSLYVKASVTVRRLVSQLSLTARQGHLSGETEEEEAPFGQRPVDGFLARELGFTPPESYHSLTDLSEALLRQLRDLDPERFEAEIPYIRAFMDWMQDWCGRGGNDLGAFLRDWAQADPQIAPPEDALSLRLMTVHKSKGLEFPLVILPFIEKTVLFKDDTHWCIPATAGTPLEGIATGAYPVVLSGKSKDSLFAADLKRETLLQQIDNLNISYVAMTRPVYGLKLIGKMPSKEFMKSLQPFSLKKEPELFAEWKTLSDLLYGFVTAGDSGFRIESDPVAIRYFSGEPYDFARLHTKPTADAQEEALSFPPAYPSWPLNPPAEEDTDLPLGERGRLKFSAEAADFFGPDGTVGAAASRRIRGTVLHEILSRVRVPEDLPGAVRSAVRKGLLRGEDAAEAENALEGAIRGISARYPDWYAPEAEVISERAIIRGDGAVFRPDRIVILPDGSVTVIDYKFGTPHEAELRGYRAQIGRYAGLLRGMGYGKVSAFLWYPLEAPGQDVFPGTD